MTDNEKLIEEARRWPEGMGPIPSAAPGNLITRLADALEAAEKAHTPTDDEREAHRRVIDLWFANWRSIGKVSPALEVAIDSLEGMVSDALDAGFRRSEVPEPSTEGWSTEDRREALAEGLRRWSVQSQHDRLDQRDQDLYAMGARQGFVLGAEWWKATHSESQGEPSDAGTTVVVGVYEPSDDEVRAAALAMYQRQNSLSMAGATTLARAALRAAGGVR